MANELDPEIVREFQEKLVRAGLSAEQAEKQIALLADAAKTAKVDLGKFFQQIERSFLNNTDNLNKFVGALKRGQDTYGELGATVNKVADSINKAADKIQEQAERTGAAETEANKQRTAATEETRKQVEQQQKFSSATESAGRSLGDFARGLSGSPIEKLLDMAMAAERSEEAIEKFTRRHERGLNENRATFGKLTESLITGRKTFGSFASQIKSLKDQIADLDNEIEKATGTEGELLRQKRQALIVARVQLEQQEKINVGMEGMHNVLKKLGAGFGDMAKRAFSTVGDVAKGLQGGASTFDVANTAFSGAMDVANTGMQTIGSGMQAAGAAGMMLPGALKILGAGALIAGTAINGLSDAATATGKFIVSFMLRQLEITAESFRKLSSSGVLFTNGMTGMYQASERAGISLPKLAAGLEKASNSITDSGLGMTEGTRRITNTLGMNDGKLKRTLMNLGYSFEEMPGVVADTMALMRQYGQPLRATDADIAEQTEKYATNLRIIQNITGQDAKAKQEQSRKNFQQLAFQQKLVDLFPDPKKLSDFKMAFENMTEPMQRMIMDMVNFGVVRDKQLAVLLQASPGMQAELAANMEALKAGTLNAEKAREIQAQFFDQIQKDLLKGDAARALAIATAAGNQGIAGQIGALLGQELEMRKKMTPEAIKAAEEAAAKQKAANDALTQKVVEAQLAGEAAAMKLQEIAKQNLDRAALFTQQVLDGITNALTTFNNWVNGTEKPADTFRDKLGRLWEELKTQLNKVWNEMGPFEKALVVATGALLAFSAVTAVASGLIAAFKFLKDVVTKVGVLLGRTPPVPPGGAQPGPLGDGRGPLPPKSGGMAGRAAVAGAMVAAPFLIDTVAGTAGVGKDYGETDIAQDEANWQKMSWWQKTQSSIARGIETAGDVVGMGNIANQARKERIAKETEYLSQKTSEGLPGGVAPRIPAGLGVNGRQGVDPIHPALQAKLDLLAAAFPGATITGLNDVKFFPAHAKGDHGQGRAVDFTIPGYRPEMSAEIVKKVKEMGFSRVIDEYKNPSPNATGGHIHAGLENGGVVAPTPGGRTIKVGEGGSYEGVFPFDKNKPFPMKLDDTQFKQLVNVLTDQLNMSKKLLSATQ